MGDELAGEIAHHSPLAPFRLCINDFHLGIFRSVIAFLKFDKGMPSALAVIQLLQRRGGRSEDYVGFVDHCQHQSRIAAIISRGRRILFV